MSTEEARAEIQRALGRIEASLEAVLGSVEETKARVGVLEKFRTLVLVNLALVVATIAPKVTSFLSVLFH